MPATFRRLRDVRALVAEGTVRALGAEGTLAGDERCSGGRGAYEAALVRLREAMRDDLGADRSS